MLLQALVKFKALRSMWYENNEDHAVSMVKLQELYLVCMFQNLQLYFSKEGKTNVIAWNFLWLFFIKGGKNWEVFERWHWVYFYLKIIFDRKFATLKNRDTHSCNFTVDISSSINSCSNWFPNTSKICWAKLGLTIFCCIHKLAKENTSIHKIPNLMLP